MTTPRQSFRQRDVSRALRAARAAGVNIARVEITDGKIVLVTGDPVAGEPANGDDGLDSELAAFEASHGQS